MRGSEKLTKAAFRRHCFGDFTADLDQSQREHIERTTLRIVG
jgi:hypothetical protein